MRAPPTRGWPRGKNMEQPERERFGVDPGDSAPFAKTRLIAFPVMTDRRTSLAGRDRGALRA